MYTLLRSGMAELVAKVILNQFASLINPESGSFVSYTLPFYLILIVFYFIILVLKVSLYVYSISQYRLRIKLQSFLQNRDSLIAV